MERHQHNEKCKEVFALLSDYLNLELPPEAYQDVEAHIAGCPPCIEFADSLRKTVRLCRQYEPTDLPAPIGQLAKAQLLEAYGRMIALTVPACGRTVTSSYLERSPALNLAKVGPAMYAVCPGNPGKRRQCIFHQHVSRR